METTPKNYDEPRYDGDMLPDIFIGGEVVKVAFSDMPATPEELPVGGEK